MPISLHSRRQIKRVLCGVLSGGVSVILLSLFFWAWPKLVIGEKIKEIPDNPLSETLSAKSINDLKQSYAVTLPTPPKIEKIRISSKLKMTKVVEKKVVKPLKRGPGKPVQKTHKLELSTDDKNIVVPASTMAKEGRVLLRLLEHGSGPSIEFVWPEDSLQRSQLFRVLTQCHDMRVALLDMQDRLFVRESPRGEKWQINLDRYSMFMRQVSGGISQAEHQEILHIRQRQSIVGSGVVVRVFSRKMDAYVLGGLNQILGEGYRAKRSIRAQYKITNNTIMVTNIVTDGVKKNGIIKVPCRG